MTKEHFVELEKRLAYLEVEGRAEATERIRVAREFGDLSENAEYDIAKDEQAKIEAEIVDIRAKLRLARIIEGKSNTDRIDIGSTVTVKNMKTNKEATYALVGSSESNPFNGKISYESPLGAALRFKKKGDDVEVVAPNGIVSYKVVKIGK